MCVTTSVEIDKQRNLLIVLPSDKPSARQEVQAVERLLADLVSNPMEAATRYPLTASEEFELLLSQRFLVFFITGASGVANRQIGKTVGQCGHIMKSQGRLRHGKLSPGRQIGGLEP